MFRPVLRPGPETGERLPPKRPRQAASKLQELHTAFCFSSDPPKLDYTFDDVDICTYGCCQYSQGSSDINSATPARICERRLNDRIRGNPDGETAGFEPVRSSFRR